MLKELNKIAAGLLGLHGYPTQPWTATCKDAAPDRKPASAGGPGRNDTTQGAITRPRLATRVWR